MSSLISRDDIRAKADALFDLVKFWIETPSPDVAAVLVDARISALDAVHYLSARKLTYDILIVRFELRRIVHRLRSYGWSQNLPYETDVRFFTASVWLDDIVKETKAFLRRSVDYARADSLRERAARAAWDAQAAAQAAEAEERRRAHAAQTEARRRADAAEAEARRRADEAEAEARRRADAAEAEARRRADDAEHEKLMTNDELKLVARIIADGIIEEHRKKQRLFAYSREGIEMVEKLKEGLRRERRRRFWRTLFCLA